MKRVRGLAALAVAAGMAASFVGSPAAPARNGCSLPCVSPDGSRIVFLREHGDSSWICIIAADGTGERSLRELGPVAGAPRWAGPGWEILYAGAGADTGQLTEVRPDGTHKLVVASVPGRSPVLSPNGRRVLFLMGPWTSTVLAVAEADGSKVRRLAGGRTTAWNGAWSPDGRRVAYTCGDSTRVLQVHVANADGTGDHAVTRMPREEGSAQMPAWSPDGKRLAIQVSDVKSHRAHIWVVDAAGGEARKLAPHAEAYLDEVPSWFPDGRRLAFQSDRGGSMQLWVMNADGTGARQLTE